MNERPRRLRRRAAEQLLSGERHGARSEHEDLAALLTAAGAPARPSELAGERAVMAGFRQARLAGPPRASRRLTLAARLMPAKVLAAVVLSTAFGGVGLAASTGNLPDPIQDVAHGVLGAPPPHTAAPSASPPPSDPAGSPTGGPTGSASAGTAPAPAIVDLCRDFHDRGEEMSGKDGSPGDGDVPGPDGGNREDGRDGDGRRDPRLDDPAFAPLVEAAGGREKVARFCAAVIESSRGGPSGSAPDQTGGDSSGKPGADPDGRGNGPENKRESVPSATAEPSPDGREKPKK